MGTTNKVIDILELFLKHDEPLGITELSELSGINKSSVHRICTTLTKRGYLSQKRNRGKYNLGIQFLMYNSVVKERNELRRIAYTYMDGLHKELDETITLAVLHGDGAVYLETIETTNTLRVNIAIGSKLNLYSTGTGKVLLANMPKDEQSDFLKKTKLIRLTDNTITKVTELKKQLDSILVDGFALDLDETKNGVRNIAVPIKDINDKLVGALGILTPSMRMPENTIKSRIKILKKAALMVSNDLGYNTKK